MVLPDRCLRELHAATLPVKCIGRLTNCGCESVLLHVFSSGVHGAVRFWRRWGAKTRDQEGGRVQNAAPWKVKLLSCWVTGPATVVSCVLICGAPCMWIFWHCSAFKHSRCGMAHMRHFVQALYMEKDRLELLDIRSRVPQLLQEYYTQVSAQLDTYKSCSLGGISASASSVDHACNVISSCCSFATLVQPQHGHAILAGRPAPSCVCR